MATPYRSGHLPSLANLPILFNFIRRYTSLCVSLDAGSGESSSPDMEGTSCEQWHVLVETGDNCNFPDVRVE